MNPSILNAIVDKAAKNKLIHGAVFHVSNMDGQEIAVSATGNFKLDSRFYIASINKMISAAITLRLVKDKRLNFSDKISELLPEAYWKGILKINGKDFSGEITLQQLLSHTSGLPCYLIDKRADGIKNMDLILKEEDQSWPLEEVVSEVKKMKPKFIPGTKNKASYGETNFRLIDEILHQKNGKQIDQLYQEIFKELGMEQTKMMHLCKPEDFQPLYNKDKIIRIDAYAESSKHDVISTANDLAIFIQAYYKGMFYPKEKLPELESWNNIFFPFKYGIGIQQFYIPRILSPFKAIPKMVGHCGSSGAVAFYIPEKSVTITGTVNQTAKPSLVFQTLIKIVNKL
ncbi:serine hydrolase domain-containing protein [Aquiflexum sp.]|uniref:serine hydrolase domain-containing protein n=1 Tax=Aquiflexum sp. TaxID=1872584 RepID=UPI00359476BB